MMRKLLFALIAISALPLQAQFFEDFEGGTYDIATNSWNLSSGTWQINNNGFGTNFWMPASQVATPPYVFSGTTAAYVSRENIAVGNTEEDWLITPIVNVPPSGILDFMTRTTIIGDQETIYKICIAPSTADPMVPANFATIGIWSCREPACNHVWKQQFVYIPQRDSSGFLQIKEKQAKS